MPTPRKAAPRAYAREDKQARRGVILQAARRLLLDRGDLPTASDIAAEAGLAKGTLYLYFESREEIFATLTLEGWCEILGNFELTLRSATGNRRAKLDTFLSTFSRHFDARPELLRLDALGTAAWGPTDVATQRFKQPLVECLLQCADVLEGALDLPRGRGMQLLMRSLALTRGIWQQFNQPYPEGPWITAPADFGAELSEALLEYWRGAL